MVDIFAGGAGSSGIRQQELIALSEVYEVPTVDNLLTYNDSAIATVITKMANVNNIPKPKPERIVMCIQVLKSYKKVDYYPMTVRGVYYRMIAYYEYDKSEGVYRKIQKLLTFMRDIGVLPYSYIIDGSRNMFNLKGYKDSKDFLKEQALTYRKDYWLDMEYDVVLLVEKRTMVDTFMPVAREYGISFSSMNGANSKTAWYELFNGCNSSKLTYVLVLTDYDTAGLAMGGYGEVERARHNAIHTEFIRIGLSPEQIAQYNLSTRPDKGGLDYACDIDALSPQEAQELLRKELSRYLSDDVLQQFKQQENNERFELLDVVANLGNKVGGAGSSGIKESK